MKKVIVGIVIGFALALPLHSFASTTLEKIEAYIVQTPISYNGNEVKLANPIINHEGNTYLPMRELAELFGKSVDWNDSTQSVDLNDKKPEPIKEEQKANTIKKEDVKVEQGVLKETGEYYTNKDYDIKFPVYKDSEGNVYMVLYQALEKYNVEISSYDHNKSIKFKEGKVNIDLKQSYEYGCDGFYNEKVGIPYIYIKESLLK